MGDNKRILRNIRALALRPVGSTVRGFRAALATVEAAWPLLSANEKRLHSEMCAAAMFQPYTLYTGERHAGREALLALAARFSPAEMSGAAYEDFAEAIADAQNAADEEQAATYIVEVGSGYSWGFLIDQDAVAVCRPQQ